MSKVPTVTHPSPFYWTLCQPLQGCNLVRGLRVVYLKFKHETDLLSQNVFENTSGLLTTLEFII